MTSQCPRYHGMHHCWPAAACTDDEMWFGCASTLCTRKTTIGGQNALIDNNCLRHTTLQRVSRGTCCTFRVSLRVPLSRGRNHHSRHHTMHMSPRCADTSAPYVTGRGCGNGRGQRGGAPVCRSHSRMCPLRSPLMARPPGPVSSSSTGAAWPSRLLPRRARVLLTSHTCRQHPSATLQYRDLVTPFPSRALAARGRAGSHTVEPETSRGTHLDGLVVACAQHRAAAAVQLDLRHAGAVPCQPAGGR